MSTNYYALILEGKEPEILESWDECKAKMSGTSRPVYRKFSTEDEAKKLIAGEWRRPVSEKARKWLEEYKAKDVQLKEETQFDTSALSSRLGDLSKEGKLPCVYVDGSYNPESETYGFGVVFICDGKIEMFYGGGREKDLAETRNITGELLACMEAIKYAKKKPKCQELTIIYDCDDIQWAYYGCAKQDSWLGQAASQYMYDIQYMNDDGKMKIKVKSIEGLSHAKSKKGRSFTPVEDPGNVLADKLARKGAGLL